MSGIPDFTILVALDREHLAEFAVSYPTWVRHKPELRDRPMVFVCDGEDPEWRTRDWWNAIGAILDETALMYGDGQIAHAGRLEACFIDREVAGREFASQREKMLTGLVTVGPRHVETPYFLKLDTDCIATGCEDWIASRGWFDDSPAIIAPAWGYTRPASMLDDFNAWADDPARCEHFPLLIESRKIGNVAKHRRIISYCMFGRTDWTRKMAELAGDRLPCPSQDTFLGGCAVRSGEKIVYAPMKELGWKHVGGGGRRLREAAARAMEGQLT